MKNRSLKTINELSQNSKLANIQIPIDQQKALKGGLTTVEYIIILA